MQIRYQAAVIGMLAMMAMCSQATGQSIEAARTARERAKADLIRAQEAFDRADEAYINVLGGAAPASCVIVPANLL